MSKGGSTEPNAAARRRRCVDRGSVCEDRVRSLMVVGCGLVTASVTLGMTGLRALLRHVHSWSPAPAPVGGAGLIRSLTTWR
jgi:hypothetical protein